MENKGFYINDLPQSGEVTFLAVVVEKELRPKRNGGSFLSVRLADRSGELDAKAWDNPETVAQLFDCNDVVKVRGAMEQYNDKPQLIVSRIRRCEPQEYIASDYASSGEFVGDGERQRAVAVRTGGTCGRWNRRISADLRRRDRGGARRTRSSGGGPTPLALSQRRIAVEIADELPAQCPRVIDMFLDRLRRQV
jgi:hypothetical protein